MTIDPCFCSIIRGSTALEHKYTLFKTISRLRSHVCSSIFRMSLPRDRPALLTRMSTRPKASIAPSTIIATWADWDTSTVLAIDCAPDSTSNLEVAIARSASTSATTTSAPSAAKRTAMAQPIPDPAPVTIATALFNFIDARILAQRHIAV